MNRFSKFGVIRQNSGVIRILQTLKLQINLTSNTQILHLDSKNEKKGRETNTLQVS